MAASAPGDTVIIKKYANRRLYNTESSSYITLEHLAEMVRAKREFKVVDARTGEDITHNVLTQIIMDQESSGKKKLHANFPPQPIAMYDHSSTEIGPQYQNSPMNVYKRQQ